MVQNSWLVFPQFCAFLTNCFTQPAHNFKVVFLIDRTTLWQEFMMHHIIAIEKNSEQILHIWPNLMYFFWGPSPLNTVIEAWLRFCLWPETHAQASKCNLVRYHGAKSMIGFSTILCVSNELLANGTHNVLQTEFVI